MDVVCHITTNTEVEQAEINDEIPRGVAYKMQDLRFSTGSLTAITGPNGVGKSALIAELGSSFTGEGAVEIFFGSRRVDFESENIDHLDQSLSQLERQFRQAERYRHPYGDRQFKSVVKRVVNAEHQSASDFRKFVEQGGDIEEAKYRYPLIIEAINQIFGISLLPINIKLTDGLLKAVRDGSEFGIDRLSDGERSALMITGAVLVRPENSFIIIDEPERHLNPAISGPLLSALIRARPDLGFIFATHDLQLIDWLRPDQIIHVRNSLVLATGSESRRYELAIIEGENAISDDLRYAILGSRKKLLLVEGTTSSEDQALYGLLYPGWNILARGGWETVSSGVTALATNGDYHWLDVVGIIDGDGRDAEEVGKLSRKRVFCLPVPTIENLFLDEVVVSEIAAAAHHLFGKADASESIDALNRILPDLLTEARDDIICRRVVWLANRLLSGKKPSVASVKNGEAVIEGIDIGALKNTVSQALDIELNTANLTVLERIPVKNTIIPGRVAVTLGFDKFNSFKKSVLHQIESETAFGLKIVERLRSIMPVF